MLNRIYLVLLAGFALFAFEALGVPLNVVDGEHGSAMLSLDALIDGRPHRLLLDTGSNKSAVPFNKLTNQFAKQQSARAYGAYGQNSCDFIVVPSFSIDQVSLKDFQLGRCGNGEIGFLGIDALTDRVWKLDFTNKQLIEAPATSQADQPLRRVTYNVAEVPISISGVDGENQMALFDTGAALSSVDAKYVDQHFKSFEPVATAWIQDSAGKRVPVLIFRVAKLKVGNVEFEDVRFSATDFKTIQAFDPNLHFVLGANVIKRKNWILDLKSNRFSIEP